jgi:hypothetical protein
MPFKINDIFTAILPSINSDLDGIEPSYAECATTSAKADFIAGCQNLISNGWTNQLQVSNNDFFSDVLKPLFLNPAENYFVAKPDITKASETSIIFFARYILLNSLLKMYQTEKILIEDNAKEDMKNWFLETKNKLDEEFQQLSSMIPPIISTTRNPVKFFKKHVALLRKENERKQAENPDKDLSLITEIAAGVKNLSGIILGAMLINHYNLYRKDKEQDFRQTALLLILFVVAIYVQKKQAKKFAAGAAQRETQRHFFRDEESTQILNFMSQFNRNIKKNVFVSVADINKTFYNVNARRLSIHID